MLDPMSSADSKCSNTTGPLKRLSGRLLAVLAHKKVAEQNPTPHTHLAAPKVGKAGGGVEAGAWADFCWEGLRA